MNRSSPPFIVVSGPSGSGKTTLCRMIAGRLGLHYGISHTTRVMRSGEQGGRDYYFVAPAVFQKMVAAGDFLEWARVYGNLYGTAKKSVFDYLDRGQGVILDVDTQGAEAIKKKCREATLVFIQAPSIKELEKRLMVRGTDDPGTRAERLQKAREEQKCVGNYHFVLVNDILEKTYQELEKIVKKSDD